MIKLGRFLEKEKKEAAERPNNHLLAHHQAGQPHHPTYRLQLNYNEATNTIKNVGPSSGVGLNPVGDPLLNGPQHQTPLSIGIVGRLFFTNI